MLGKQTCSGRWSFDFGNDCLNITYDSYSPTAHPLIKRFKMVGEMKTRELALDVLVADIWEGGWINEINIRVLNVKVYI